MLVVLADRSSTFMAYVRVGPMVLKVVELLLPLPVTTALHNTEFAFNVAGRLAAVHLHCCPLRYAVFADAAKAPGSAWPARAFIKFGKVSSPRKSRLGWRPSKRASDHNHTEQITVHMCMLIWSYKCSQNTLKDHAIICVRGWIDSVPKEHHSLKVQIGNRWRKPSPLESSTRFNVTTVTLSPLFVICPSSPYIPIG